VSTPMAAPWSFSKWKAFNTCAEQFYNDKVLKRFPQTETDAMRYGTRFHEAAENYIGSGDPIPKPFLYAKAALDELIAMPGEKLVEQKMGVTADLEPCAFDDSNVWWRGIADLNIIDGSKAYSLDYKTGAKKSVPYADKGQLELIALAIFTAYPQIMEVKAALFFVVAPAFIKDRYVRADVPRLWTKWIGNFNEMQAAYKNNVWNVKESGLCYKHCPVLECPHNGRG
jgi:hypothetical protein